MSECDRRRRRRATGETRPSQKMEGDEPGASVAEDRAFPVTWPAISTTR
ncbi:hypothetical protein [Haladaptatus halobius]|nr:hypothetical protein [Haladaptatus halobius]